MTLLAALFAILLLSGCVPLLPSEPDWQSAQQGAPEDFEEPQAVAVGECPWPKDSAVDETAAVGVDPVAVTEALALDEDRFWGLVEMIPSRPREADFEATSSALAGCPLDDIVAFDARLALSLYLLDGPENLAWYEKNDPLQLGFVSDDTFLYARCATVLGGRESWSAAVDEQTLAWGDDQPDVDGYSELLLYVALEAARAQGMTMDEYFETSFSAIPVSPETGSNTERWD